MAANINTLTLVIPMCLSNSYKT